MQRVRAHAVAHHHVALADGGRTSSLGHSTGRVHRVAIWRKDDKLPRFDDPVDDERRSRPAGPAPARRALRAGVPPNPPAARRDRGAADRRPQDRQTRLPHPARARARHNLSDRTGLDALPLPPEPGSSPTPLWNEPSLASPTRQPPQHRARQDRHGLHPNPASIQAATTDLRPQPPLDRRKRDTAAVSCHRGVSRGVEGIEHLAVALAQVALG